MKNIWNNIRFESRLAPPEAGIEADEVRGPRRFRQDLSRIDLGLSKIEVGISKPHLMGPLS